MEHYETPKTEMILFDTEDVIVTSGGDWIGGGEDDDWFDI